VRKAFTALSSELGTSGWGVVCIGLLGTRKERTSPFEALCLT
jgi:hypothetical protein